MRRILAVSVMALLCLPSICLAQKKWAVIEHSSIFMRDEPGYDAENVSQSRMGTVVEVLDRQSYWVKIHTPEPYEGWTTSMGLHEMTEAQKDAYIAAPKYICIAEYTHIYSQPDENSLRVCDFLMGNMIRKGNRTHGEWVEVVRASGAKGWVRSSEVKDFGQWAKDCNPTAENIIALAKKFIGVPYMWGGMSVKHFDCSGLVGFCYFMNGVLLRRDAREQVDCGEEVPVEQMRPGDLVYFGESRISHVGLCIAPMKIIHSSQMVRINSLRKGDPDYYGRNILHVRRMLNHIDDGTGVSSIRSNPIYFKQ